MSDYRFQELFSRERGEYTVFKRHPAFPDTGIWLGVVFKWGKHWCSRTFEPFTYCKTREEAAQRLDRIKEEGE